MSIIGVIQRTPPQVFAVLILLVSRGQGLFRFATRYRLWWLLYAAIIYFGRKDAESPPFTPEEMVLWFDGLSAEIKSAIIGATVAVFGLIFAIDTGLTAWRKQQWNLMRLEAAKALRETFFDIQQQFSVMEFSLRYVINFLREEKTREPTVIPAWKLSAVHKVVVEYHDANGILGKHWTSIHMIGNRQRLIVDTVGGAGQLLDEITEAFVDYMPHIKAPMIPVGADEAHTMRMVITHFNIAKAEEHEKAFDKIEAHIAAKSSLLYFAMLNEAIGLKGGYISQKMNYQQAVKALQHLKN